MQTILAKAPKHAKSRSAEASFNSASAVSKLLRKESRIIKCAVTRPKSPKNRASIGEEPAPLRSSVMKRALNRFPLF